MKGIALIAMLAALIIVAILTLKNMHQKPSTDFQKATGLGASGNITELPSQVKSKVEGSLKKIEDRTKQAAEEIER